jgi:sugar phosphate isomerase/epimerase
MCTMSWDLDQDLAFYAGAGITNVGLALRKLEAVGLDRSVDRVAAAGLRVTNLLGLGFDLTDRRQWATHQARLSEGVAAGATLGAELFVLTTGTAGPMTWEDAADALEDALGPVIEAARGAGVPFIIEHTNSLRVDVGFVHRLADAVDLARRLNVGVLIECNACWAERGLAATIAASMDVVSLVQVSDFVIGTLATPDRAVPGDGDIPLGRIFAHLHAAGYRGVFDLELIGPRIEAEGYPSAIGRSIAAVERLLADAAA